MFGFTGKRTKEGARKGFALKDVVYILIIILLLGTMCYLVFLRQPAPPIYISQVTQLDLKDVGKLVTQEGYFTSVQVIDDWRKLFAIPVPLTQKKYVYGYDGLVSAGIDFEKISQSIDEEAKTITVIMPEAEIFNVSLFEDSFTLYHEGENLFNDLHLKEFSQSKLQMEKQIRDKALGYGILEHASKNAKNLVRKFLEQTYDKATWKIVIQ